MDLGDVADVGKGEGHILVLLFWELACEDVEEELLRSVKSVRRFNFVNGRSVDLQRTSVVDASRKGAEG
jgi:hypothetical protein